MVMLPFVGQTLLSYINETAMDCCIGINSSYRRDLLGSISNIEYRISIDQAVGNVCRDGE